MVNPKDVSAGQGEADSCKAGNRKRIRKAYSIAKTCENGIVEILVADYDADYNWQKKKGFLGV